MDNRQICGTIFLTVLGSLTLISGIQMRLGINKTWFYPSTGLRNAPVLAFGMVPMGLGLLTLDISLLGLDMDWFSKQNGILMIWASFLLIFLGPVFAIWRPRWLKPRWFRWLEDHYGDIMGELRKDAQRLDRAWLDRVRTQEGLEQWAEEVRQRHRVGTLPK